MQKKSVSLHKGPQELITKEKKQSGSNASAAIESILSNINVVQPKQKATASGGNGRINGIIIGKIVKINKKKIPMVDFECNTAKSPLAALATIPVSSKDKGRDVALGFVSGDPRAPIVLGFMHQSEAPPTHSEENTTDAEKEISKAVTVEKDGETVTISADRQIVLRCGESSITLTRAGKVLLNGKYVSSRSKGVNRIKGGSVQIN